MNLARTLSLVRNQKICKSISRKFRISSINHESSTVTQPIIQEEKYDFEDIQVLEREERRKAKIEPFMKNVFISVFNHDLLAYPEIFIKEESEALEARIEKMTKVFSDPNRNRDDRKQVLKAAKMYAAPVKLTLGGLSANHTEFLRYLEVISSDIELSQEISDHWVSLLALKLGLDENQYLQLIDDLISGDTSITLCLKEKIAERVTQLDFRTTAACDENGIWRINGEKVCRQTNGYLLVLCSVEANRLKAFLVHPQSSGVVFKEPYVTFHQTQGTPLDHISEDALAQTLAVSRLHAATLTRCCLAEAIHVCREFASPRVYGGKSLTNQPLIRSRVGSSLLTVFASESAEYFTAGLLDGYEQPDVMLEAAMCRNFMLSHGLPKIADLIDITSGEEDDRGLKVYEKARRFVGRGDSLHSMNLFIALSGLQHAGMTLSNEIKKVRNPLFNPAFILKKMFADRHQDNDNPKLTLMLAEYLHPTLRPAADSLEYSVLRMRYACETLLARHGTDVQEAHTELNRLAEAATEILAMAATVARASRAYCIGVRNAELDMKLAACFVQQSMARVKTLIREIDDGEFLNLDHFQIGFGRRVLDEKSLIVDKPTARVFW